MEEVRVEGYRQSGRVQSVWYESVGTRSQYGKDSSTGHSERTAFGEIRSSGTPRINAPSVNKQRHSERSEPLLNVSVLQYARFDRLASPASPHLANDT